MLVCQLSYPCTHPQTSERPTHVSQQGGYHRWAFPIVVKHREALCIPLDNGNGTPKNHCLLCIDQLNKICLSFLWWSILLCSSFLAQQQHPSCILQCCWPCSESWFTSSGIWSSLFNSSPCNTDEYLENNSALVWLVIWSFLFSAASITAHLFQLSFRWSS